MSIEDVTGSVTSVDEITFRCNAKLKRYHGVFPSALERQISQRQLSPNNPYVVLFFIFMRNGDEIDDPETFMRAAWACEEHVFC